MNDRDLVIYIKSNKGTHREHDQALTALWKRYQNQIHNNWHYLARTLHSSDLIMSVKDDFYEEAQEVFMTVLSKVDPVKINADEKWKFVGYFDFYLRNLRTKFHKDLMRRVERLEGERNCERAVKTCLEKWTPIQREIYKRLLAKKKKQDISKELNLSIPKLYTECNKMKRDMKRCLGILD